MRAIAFEWETTHTSNGQISRIARVITYLHFHSTLFPRNTFQTRRMIPRNDRTERTTYPRCFVLFLSFRYFRLIIFRATVSYTRIREFHRTNSHYSHETKIWTVSFQSFFLSSWTWKSFFGYYSWNFRNFYSPIRSQTLKSISSDNANSLEEEGTNRIEMNRNFDGKIVKATKIK